MRFIAKNSITDIIVMRNLYFIKEYRIFKFCRISYNGALSYDCIATDKCTVTYFCVFSDNRRSMNISSRCNGC